MILEERANKLLVVALSPSSAPAERKGALRHLARMTRKYGPHDLVLMLKGKDEDVNHFLAAFTRVAAAEAERDALREQRDVLELKADYFESLLPPSAKNDWRKFFRDLAGVAPPEPKPAPAPAPVSPVIVPEPVQPAVVAAPSPAPVVASPKKKKKSGKKNPGRNVTAPSERFFVILSCLTSHGGHRHLQDIHAEVAGTSSNLKDLLHRMAVKLPPLVTVSGTHEVAITDAGTQMYKAINISLKRTPNDQETHAPLLRPQDPQDVVVSEDQHPHVVSRQGEHSGSGADAGDHQSGQ